MKHLRFTIYDLRAVLLVAFFSLLPAMAHGQTLIVPWKSFTLTPLAGKRVEVLPVPVNQPNVFNTNVIGSDLGPFTNDVNGVTTISPIVPGTYKISISGNYTITPIQVTITNGTPTNATLNAVDILSRAAATNTAANNSYTIAAANARFLTTNDVRAGTNMTAQTNGLVITLNAAAAGGTNFVFDTNFTVAGTNVTLSNTAVSAGQYTKVTVDAKGRVNAGTTITTADVGGLGTIATINSPVPIANGGTAATTAQNAAKNVGVYPVNDNTAPSDTGSYARQLGISASGYFVWWDGSAWQNYANHLGGVSILGDPYRMPAGHTYTEWYLGGNPADQTAASANVDNQVNFVSMNPYGSGSGLSVAWVTTNASGNGVAISTNSLGVPIYMQDIHASSYVMTSDQGPFQDLPGFTQIIQNGQAPFALAVVTTVGGSNGNYSSYQFDLTGITHFPKWVAGKYKYSTSGWLDALSVNHNNGNVSIGTTGSAVTTAGTSLATGSSQSVTLQPAAGTGIQIDSSGNTTINSGGVNTGTASFKRIISTGTAGDGYSTAAAPFATIGTAGGGVGLYQDSSDAHLHFSAGGADAGYINYSEHTNWYPKGNVIANAFVSTNGYTGNDLTASRAVATDSNKKLVSSGTTSTELGYLSGVTSAIQTQLDGKQASFSTQTSNTVYMGPLSGSAAAPTFKAITNFTLWPRQIVNGTPGVVSNTTAETSILDTNNLLGRTQGIQPDEMAAGRTIRFHFFGFATASSAQAAQWRVRVGGSSGTVVLDTGSVNQFTGTTTPVEVYGALTFFSTNQCRGWMVVKYEALGDVKANSTTLTTYATVTNTVQQQLVFTVQPANSAFVWQTTSAIIEFY